ncbi:unnamed protein product [Schistosoma turkestanicum]|nr:unnamed protein product [Schistosoma turkestanicum]
MQISLQLVVSSNLEAAQSILSVIPAPVETPTKTDDEDSFIGRITPPLTSEPNGNADEVVTPDHFEVWPSIIKISEFEDFQFNYTGNIEIRVCFKSNSVDFIIFITDYST